MILNQLRTILFLSLYRKRFFCVRGCLWCNNLPTRKVVALFVFVGYNITRFEKGTHMTHSHNYLLILGNRIPHQHTTPTYAGTKTRALDLSIGLTAFLSIIVISYVLFMFYFPWASGMGGVFEPILLFISAFSVPITVLIFLIVHHHLSEGRTLHKRSSLETV